ncbi:MAG TPA: UDP-N-acetylmuramoyl-L-alanine--D-glutamate ligase [Candidatus Limnocylindria bacterium]|nr:UDP-N-acetylmuramoyl-L-alanine--D-glutamate ligase [Candidatus Limnocylindria bacterium]
MPADRSLAHHAPGGAIDPAALVPGALSTGVFRDREASVLGFARSGIALARFLVDAGAVVTVYDARPAAELAKAVAALDGRTVRLLLGPDIDPAEAVAGAALVTTSPSINPDYPTTEPRLRAVLADLVARRAAGDGAAPAIVSEVGLFLRLCPARTIGITGTKGKTTTSSLAYALLAHDLGDLAVLGGNIGVPLIERLPRLTERHVVVLELSELQLPTLSRGTSVAAYTNVTADHLDRHGSLDAYRRVKRRLAELVDPAGALVLNLDDPIVAEYGPATTARVVPYRRGEVPPGGIGVAHGWIVADGIRPLEGPAPETDEPVVGGRVLPLAELSIPGAHNVSNALAAVAIAILFGVSSAAIRRAAAAFAGVEHRLERVADLDGVRFVNDSQGTQPDAVIAALRAFDGPVVLIAGGRDKGVDLTELAGVVARRAAAAVLIGESAPALERLFRDAGLANIERADSLEAAVEAADALARGARAALAARNGGASGNATATVLLSPAAASFDMFEDYEARGRAFKAAVARLAEGRD